MSDSTLNKNQLETSLTEQVYEKMTDKLNQSEFFHKSIIQELMSSDLSNKESIKAIISKYIKDPEDENTEAGN